MADLSENIPAAQIIELAALWDIRCDREHPGLVPPGSPERTLLRIVFADEQGAKFLLERIAERDRENKQRIIDVLSRLRDNGMPRIIPYLTANNGNYIVEHANGLWQLSLFLEGARLDRPNYIYDGWRAPLMASFLQDLREHSRGLNIPVVNVFSIKNYIYTLTRQITIHQPRIADAVQGIVDHLEQGFMGVHDRLPAGFCHGDFHALNMIWSENDIQAVIDWEFMGMKPEIYDVVNMTGCLGIEHPSCLYDELVRGFVTQLRRKKIFTPLSWEWLVEFIIALRFAWLSEWLRKSDEDMIGLELDYMRLLINESDKLKLAWRL